ncbi:hypothetical protein AB4Z21_38770, partial [Paenibacillus sp. MCAF20]
MITEYKDVLKKSGIVFEDQPSPEQKEMIIARLKQRNTKSNKEYKSAEEFVEQYYPMCITVKDALERQFGKENIVYAKGCELKKAVDGGIEEVKKAVEQADLVIAVIGGKES